MLNFRVLVDNNTKIDHYYFGEPGASYYIEVDDKKILFDTGYSGVFMKNAELLGIDLSKVTHIVLSHGHDDHTGGLKPFFEKFDTKDMELICHEECLLPKYYDGEYIGSPYNIEEIKEYVKYRPENGFVEFAKDFYYLGQIPRVTDFENKIPIGEIEKNGEKSSDFIMDDTALVYKTDDGLFVITGCSHSGICNIIEYAKKVCNEERIVGVIGGFHLLKDNEQLDRTIEFLETCNIAKFYPCHCVSLVAKAKMFRTLPVKEVAVGLQINL